VSLGKKFGSNRVNCELAEVSEGRDAVIFQTFGPFRIRLDEYRNILRKLEEFWAEVEEKITGLSDAKGC
jgi:hypothetical protein